MNKNANTYLEDTKTVFHNCDKYHRTDPCCNMTILCVYIDWIWESLHLHHATKYWCALLYSWHQLFQSQFYMVAEISSKSI